MKRARDAQRERVYRAERCTGFQGDLSMPEMRELQAYVMKVFLSKWQKKKYGCRMPTVKDGRRHKHAEGGAQHLVLPRWARSPIVTLHECAHAIHCQLEERRRARRAGSTEPFKYQAWHGREYCAIFLDLVRHFMGREAHDRLRCEFKAQKVKYRPKSNRKPSPQAIEALRRYREKAAADRRPQ